jgi:hypothetical protein
MSRLPRAVSEDRRLEHLFSTSDTDILQKVREGLVAAGYISEWNECAKIISDLIEVDTEKAELCLAKALEWRAWAIAPSETFRNYVKTKAPDAAKLRDSLSWLSTEPIGIPIAILKMAISTYPEVYLVDPKARYETSLSCAPMEYSTPAQFHILLHMDPSALKNTYNCATADQGCASNCGNCWVTYRQS